MFYCCSVRQPRPPRPPRPPNELKRRRFQPEDWDELDVAYDDDLTVLDTERLQINETGQVVGKTAVIEDEELVLTQGKLPQVYDVLHLSC
jgi:hypothetical protein